MKDYLVKALAFDGEVRAYSVRTTNTVSEAQRRHDTWRTASAALGRSLTAGTMMGAMLKGDQKLTIKVEGNGPIGPILVDAHANGDVRGYVTNPHVDFEGTEQGKLRVYQAVGTEGFVTVIKDIGMREPFIGQSPIVSGELGEDFTYYFAVSEQTPSSVGVGVLVNGDDSILAAGGFILQIMPGAQEETISFIEERLQKILPVSTLIEQGLSPEELLYAVLGEDKVKVLETMDVQFNCTCSRERIESVLISLGKTELEQVREEEEETEVHCHFCNERYKFSKEDITNLIENL
ncbi:redox-regulated molecular chaperone HslO [Bacillus cereus group sp. BfR-BA-00331]|uniref:redox-regulated molecular chaperone HslO n=1 Tax=Bacillus cereus group TaxID=86661 RepID=UPI0007721E20|nr:MULTISPECIES: redox-regulated molecular chaperone HslO [Bacillus cereus group]ONG67801.1 Hsp33 family molecular chaperone [Bacillus cereus]MDA2196792.1 redox-regulated molecular chaperone HslO [Bacillus cereus group sp. Bc238]MDA2202508.1 redox-regulated molecular chaperone HslO [Bacillus cereus group sp. Bc237]MDA2665372.1 redox-regulated molecular chaperone HslO [Bacillus cereus group sp. Bc032]MDA2676159.1 redox-regulated molecular chaperone HslO [Bacillus cereus group sp. Bc031]